MNRQFVTDIPDMTRGHKDIEPGLGLLRTFIEDPNGRRHLYINPTECPETVTAIKEHHYKMDKNNELGEEPKPDSAFKDPIDAMRYTVITVVTKLGRKVPGISRVLTLHTI